MASQDLRTSLIREFFVTFSGPTLTTSQGGEKMKEEYPLFLEKISSKNSVRSMTST